MTTYLTPGPSHPYPKLKIYLDDAWNDDIIPMSHRSQKFSDQYKRTDEALRALMSIPPTHRILFMGSATEAMERLVEGLSADRSHHITLGAFGEKWLQISDQLGKKTSSSHLRPETDSVPAVSTPPEDAELICVTLNETSNGSRMPDNALQALAKRPANQFLAIDMVSAAPLIRIDWAKTDAAFFSVQKAFGLPAGLGVLIVNDRALGRAGNLQKSGIHIGTFHSLVSLAESSAKFQTPETPNVLGIYLLGRVAEDMLHTGADSLKASTDTRAHRIYDVIGNHPHITAYVKHAAWQSPTVIVADIAPNNSEFLERLKLHDFAVGKGYRPEHKEKHVRIANFPAISDEAFDTLIAHIQNWAA